MYIYTGYCAQMKFTLCTEEVAGRSGIKMKDYLMDHNHFERLTDSLPASLQPLFTLVFGIRRGMLKDMCICS